MVTPKESVIRIAQILSQNYFYLREEVLVEGVFTAAWVAIQDYKLPSSQRPVEVIERKLPSQSDCYACGSWHDERTIPYILRS